MGLLEKYKVELVNLRKLSEDKTLTADEKARVNLDIVEKQQAIHRQRLERTNGKDYDER